MAGRGRPRKLIREPGKRGRAPGQKNKDKGLQFRRAIHATSKSLGIQLSWKKSSMDLMNTIVEQIFHSIVRQAANLLEHTNVKLLNKRTVEKSVKMLFPGEMAIMAKEGGELACLKFTQYEKP